jgi:hypothetical protein
MKIPAAHTISSARASRIIKSEFLLVLKGNSTDQDVSHDSSIRPFLKATSCSPVSIAEMSCSTGCLPYICLKTVICDHDSMPGICFVRDYPYLNRFGSIVFPFSWVVQFNSVVRFK